jgi:hypothetical protein
MRQYLPNVHLLLIEVNNGYEPEFIASNVKNEIIVNFINSLSTKIVGQILKGMVFGVKRLLIPSFESTCGVRVFFNKFPKSPVADNPHDFSLFHFVINLKSV